MGRADLDGLLWGFNEVIYKHGTVMISAMSAFVMAIIFIIPVAFYIPSTHGILLSLFHFF